MKTKQLKKLSREQFSNIDMKPKVEKPKKLYTRKIKHKKNLIFFEFI